MKVEIISPKDDLVATIAAGLRPDGRDYSRSWIVFPEKRPGYYLRKILAEREGSGFIPPVADSIDGFIDRVYTERLGRNDRPIDVLDAVALLFDIHRSAPGRLGGDRFVSADDFFPLGVKLFSDLEELAAGGVRREDLLALERWTDESLPAETVNRLQSLSYFSGKFAEAVEAGGFSTPSSRFRAVAENLRPEMFPDVDTFIFAGFFSLTKAEESLLKTLLGWDKAALFLLKGRGLETLLSKLGIADSGLFDPREDPGEGPPIEFIKSPDTHGQVFALNAALADGILDRKAVDERNVVVLPASETLFPLYQQTLSALREEDFNISMGYPLARTPVYTFFDKLMELVRSAAGEGRLYGPAYLAFVLHPYTKNIFFPDGERRADWTRIMFHALEEELVRRRAKAFWSIEELETDPGIRESIQDLVKNLEGAPDIAAFMEHLHEIHARTVVPFGAIRDVADFAGKLAGVLNYIYDNSTARSHYFFHPYAEAFAGRLEALGRSLLGAVAFADKESYFNLLRKVVASGSVPFFGTPLRGLQVLGFWETRGIRFDEVSILDMNEGVLPPSARTDSLLPFGVRKALNLPTYRDDELRLEYFLDTLIRGARKVRLFFVENNDRERSRFVEKLLWEKQKREREPRTDAFVRTLRYEVALQTNPPAPIAKTREIADFLASFTYSATSLDSYLACPLRFYYGYVLNLREREDTAERTERKDVGTFVHSILEEYFQPFAGRILRARDLDPAGMESLVERRFRARYGDDVAGSIYLMEIQWKRHLAEFIADYQIPAIRDLEARGSTLRLLGLERKISALRKVRGREFRLNAKLDRMESRGGDVCIIDYKTSANEKYLGINFKKLDPVDRETWGRQIASLQLPLYHMIFAASNPPPAGDVRGLFLLLGKNRLGPGIEFSPYDEENGPGRREQTKIMEGIIDGLLAEIADPAVPFDPALAREGACEGCPYAAICGRL
ncbi:MAG: PD-(D/E)XK nuclease family protein [Candidatus Aminicenantales bacterium]